MWLTEADKEMLPLISRGRFDLPAHYYLLGFVPLPWQYAYFYVPSNVKDVTVIAGIASGKTRINAAAGILKCISIPYYKRLNTSVTAKQAELPFDMVMSWIDGNPRLERHISDIKKRPWPIIECKNGSYYEFRTSGLDGRFIRGTEYDEIDYDEAALDMRGETVKVLRGRLRGSRIGAGIESTPRIARLNVVTSPGDPIWIRERYYKGESGNDAKLPNYLSFKIKTRDNTFLAEEQIVAMESEYSDEMRRVEMEGEFPDYGISMFPTGHVSACTYQEILDTAYIGIEENKVGYNVEEHPRHGIVKFEMPFHSSGKFVLAGDPGTDDPPKRNASCVVVFDTSKMPAKMVYFDWISGKGSYMPFIQSVKYAINKYLPALKMIDTTSTQKMMQELAFESAGIEVDGVNFSSDKQGMLNSLNLAITNHKMAWPPIKGLIRQLNSYSRDSDKDKDFPQDIVMTMSMAAYAVMNSYSEHIADKYAQRSMQPFHRIRASRKRRK